MAQALKNVRNLVFAQVDLSANDLDGLDIVDLPTIFFYTAGQKKNPIKFYGIPSHDNLLNFLKLYVT